MGGGYLDKRAFTLIELLAVIVILAIIALIATPVILGIINDARNEAKERSKENYLVAAKQAVIRYQMNNPNIKITGTCTVNSNGNLNCQNVTDEIIVDVDNERAKEGGTIVFDNNGNYESDTIEMGDNNSLPKKTNEFEYGEYKQNNGEFVIKLNSDGTGTFDNELPITYTIDEINNRVNLNADGQITFANYRKIPLNGGGTNNVIIIYGIGSGIFVTDESSVVNPSNDLIGIEYQNANNDSEYKKINFINDDERIILDIQENDEVIHSGEDVKKIGNIYCHAELGFFTINEVQHTFTILN